jgi:hypothetical protein
MTKFFMSWVVIGIFGPAGIAFVAHALALSTQEPVEQAAHISQL